MKELKERTSRLSNYQCSAFEYSSSGSDNENRTSFKRKKTVSHTSLISLEKPEKKTKVFLSRWIRLILFFLLIFFSIAIDFDAGIIVSCYKTFIEDLGMTDFQYGSLNSISTIGKIIALLFYMLLINKDHRKLILVINAIFHGLYFFTYFCSSNYLFISILRFVVSFCKVFIGVYLPVWIDQFGIKKYKTLFLTICFMVSSYGRIVGAGIGTIIFKNDWQKAFICCGVFFLILSFCIFAVPQKYFSTKYMFVEKQKIASGATVEKLVLTKGNNEIDDKKNKIKEINLDEDVTGKFHSSKKIISIKKENYNKNKNDDENNYKKKLLEEYEKSTENININMKKLSTITKIKYILYSLCFIFSSLSRACIFFTFKIIHVFLKKYVFEALNYKDEIKFFSFYSITTIAAPSLGSLIGGAICNKFLGGYESRRSIWLILFFGYLSVFFITMVRISSDFNYLICYVFGYFFSISAFLPTISGYIINSLHKELKGFGSTADSLLTNIFGKLPGPIIYGLFNDKYKNENPRFAWSMSLTIYYIGIIFISLACWFKWKKRNSRAKLSKKIVEKTVQDVYNFNRSSLVRAEKPVPEDIEKKQYGEEVELDEIKYSSQFLETGNNKEEKLVVSKKIKKVKNNVKNRQDSFELTINGRAVDDKEAINVGI